MNVGGMELVMIVVEVLVNVEETATDYLTTREVELNYTADSELPGKDIVVVAAILSNTDS